MDLAPSRLLCVVVPCYDEELMVELTYSELKRALSGLSGYRHLIYFVDDGSRDATLAKLNQLACADLCVRVVALSRNFGHQAAITAGLDHVDRRADAVVVLDADLETPPSAMVAMVDAFERGNDVVMGVREAERSVGLLRRMASRTFYRLFNRLSDVPIMPGAPDFFLLSARAREALGRMPERQRFVRGMVAWIGFSQAYVPYRPPPRPRGQSKYTLRRMLALGADALYGFSSAPVRGALWIGAALGCAGALVLVGTAAFGWTGGSVSWLAWLTGLLLLLSGIQLGALGALGGYIVRALEAARERPLYLVKQLPDERGADDRLVGLSGKSYDGPRRRQQSPRSQNAMPKPRSKTPASR